MLDLSTLCLRVSQGVSVCGGGPFVMHPLLLGEGVHPDCTLSGQRRWVQLRDGVGGFSAGRGISGQRQPSWLTEVLRTQPRCDLLSLTENLSWVL